MQYNGGADKSFDKEIHYWIPVKHISFRLDSASG